MLRWIAVGLVLALGAGIGGWGLGNRSTEAERAEWTELKTRLEARETEIQALQSELARLNDLISQKETERTEAIKRLSSETASVTEVRNRAETLETRLAATEESLRTAMTARDEAEEKMQRYRRELLGLEPDAEVSRLRAELSALREEVARLQSGTSPRPAPSAPAVSLLVTVLSVSEDQQVVALDLGRNSGLLPGRELTLFDNQENRLRFVVTEVRETFTIGRLQAFSTPLSALVKGQQLRLSAPL
jgi:myosin heavy subunit